MSTSVDPAQTTAASAPSSGSGASLATRILRVDAAGLLFCIAMAAGAYILGVAPVFDARAQVEEKRRLIEEQTRNADDAEQLLADKRTEQQALQRQLQATSVQLRPASDLNRRLAVISELVELHALEVQSLDPGTATTDPAIGKFALVPIRFSGTGRFTDVAAFLHELLADRFPDMEVRTLSIVAAPPQAVAAPRTVPATTGILIGPPSQNPTPEKGSFAIELRWYAAPAGSAAEKAAP